jgi:membrane-associated protein
MQTALDVVLHLDRHLDTWVQAFGPWLYLILFGVIFCETGLVVTPFLPGDSLLFAVGAVASTSATLSMPIVVALLFIAAVLGDAVNYMAGCYIGPRVFTSEQSWLLNKKHLMRTHRFYEKYGGKTIVFARFIPIVRTFAPFVAGIGKMEYYRFAIYNVAGAAAWVLVFVIAGYQFGNVPVVKRNFSLVILAIIIVSVMPAVWEFVRMRMHRPGPPGASIGGGGGQFDDEVTADVHVTTPD